MESPNLTQLNQFQLKGLTNRYCMCCIKYPNNSTAVVGELVDSEQDSSLFNRRESIDEDFQVEGECFVYSTNMTVFSIEIKQPTYVHQQICLNLEKDQTMIPPIQCLTAFPLPSHYQSSQSILPIPTCILLVYDILVQNERKTPSTEIHQIIKLYEDRGKEIHFDLVENQRNLLYQNRIIWVDSHYIPVEKGCLVIIIIGYSNCQVSVFSLEFDQNSNDIIKQQKVNILPTISLLVNYKFSEIILLHDIFLVSHCTSEQTPNVKLTLIDFCMCFTSFDGQISLVTLKLSATTNDYTHNKLNLVEDHLELMTINRQLSQPKFFQQKQNIEDDFILENPNGRINNNFLYLVIPIQNGELLCFTDVLKQKLKQYQKVKLREENIVKGQVTAFDVHEKRHECQQILITKYSRIQSAGSFEICLMHFDGSLQIYKMTMIDNQILISLQLMKSLNYARFFLNSSQFSFKQFILLGSEEEMEVYEMSFYQIN